MANNTEDWQQHYLGTGIALGAGIGTAMGIVFDNLAIGISLGAGLGLVLGLIIGAQRADESKRRSPKGDNGDG